MKTIKSFTFSLVLMAVAAFACVQPAHGQDVSNLYLAGGSYSQGASPSFAGTGFYAHRLNDSGTYAFTMIDALPASSKPFTVTTNVGVGVAQRVVTIAGFPVFVPTSLSISYNSQNVGWAYSTGAGVPFRIKGSKWFAMPTARVLKSNVSGAGYQPVIGILFGTGS